MIVLRLRARQAALWSVVAGLVLVGAHAVVSLLVLGGMLRPQSRIHGLLSLTGELNLPAWVSAMELLLAAALALIVARRDHLPEGARGSGWYTLAGLIALHSVDEACGFHERLAGSIPAMLGAANSGEQWLLVGGALALGMLAWFAPLLRRFSADARTAFLRAGLLYYGGAVVLNALAVIVERGGHSTRYLLVSTLAETAELLGIAALLYAIIRQQELAPVAIEKSRRG